jgi:hypothetical protein
MTRRLTVLLLPEDARLSRRSRRRQSSTPDLAPTLGDNAAVIGAERSPRMTASRLATMMPNGMAVLVSWRV